MFCDVFESFNDCLSSLILRKISEFCSCVLGMDGI